jgi:hypothetical protein
LRQGAAQKNEDDSFRGKERFDLLPNSAEYEIPESLGSRNPGIDDNDFVVRKPLAGSLLPINRVYVARFQSVCIRLLQGLTYHQGRRSRSDHSVIDFR